MTKREKIIQYLADNGIDILSAEETEKWQRPGTIVVNTHYLTREESRKLEDIRLDINRPVDIHGIRYHFEWQYGLDRIVWIGA